MTDDFLRDNYIPNVYQKTIYSIDYDKLKAFGVKLISFDIDETIAGDNDKDPPKTAVTLFENLKDRGFQLMLLTNAGSERAKHFADILNVKYISNAKKPLTKNFQKIIKNNNLKNNQMAHVGNNQFDDVAGGNSLGIITCLVNNCSGKNLDQNEMKLRSELKKRGILDMSKFYQLKRR